MMNIQSNCIQRSDIEKITLIEEGKKIDINEVMQFH